CAAAFLVDHDANCRHGNETHGEKRRDHPRADALELERNAHNECLPAAGKTRAKESVLGHTIAPTASSKIELGVVGEEITEPTVDITSAHIHREAALAFVTAGIR